jgi:hypothetical protein
MQIHISTINNTQIAIFESEDIIIRTVQDALDLMANCQYNGSNKLIIYEKNIATEFFDLKTRLAGDILQKFSNYRVQLAIIGDFSKYSSKSLHDFIFESNKHKHISFVETIEEAREILSH